MFLWLANVHNLSDAKLPTTSLERTRHADGEGVSRACERAGASITFITAVESSMTARRTTHCLYNLHFNLRLFFQKPSKPRLGGHPFKFALPPGLKCQRHKHRLTALLTFMWNQPPCWYSCSEFRCDIQEETWEKSRVLPQCFALSLKRPIWLILSVQHCFLFDR